MPVYASIISLLLLFRTLFCVLIRHEADLCRSNFNCICNFSSTFCPLLRLSVRKSSDKGHLESINFVLLLLLLLPSSISNLMSETMNFVRLLKSETFWVIRFQMWGFEIMRPSDETCSISKYPADHLVALVLMFELCLFFNNHQWNETGSSVVEILIIVIYYHIASGHNSNSHDTQSGVRWIPVMKLHSIGNSMHFESYSEFWNWLLSISLLQNPIIISILCVWISFFLFFSLIFFFFFGFCDTSIHR